MAGFGQAIQNQLQAGGANSSADPTATVTVLASWATGSSSGIAGAGVAHSLSFGAVERREQCPGHARASPTRRATNAANPTITGATNLGVARMVSATRQRPA